MTAMPQLVALFNGVGGGTVALIAWAEFIETDGFSVFKPEQTPTVALVVGSLFAAIIGSVSFWGSLVAFAKLQETIIPKNVEKAFVKNAKAFQAAKAFGAFQALLADLPGERLVETIPNFHHTPSRYAAFEAALAKDAHGRAREAATEIAFAQARAHEVGTIVEAMARGEIPERVTHNDTKLNNVLLDNETQEGICVIDLDTVMPGSALYDFGDLVRTSTSPAAEDETDLSKVTMQLPMFEALVKGYLASAGGFLTPRERALLPFAGKLITFEIGLRFLTDWLEGDVYFKIKRPRHNLDRLRTQFKLVESIEAQLPAMQALVR
jgi:Ser/Thr protein kinase RdoA (MazF antagonist)